MPGTNARRPAGQNLTALRNVATQLYGILIVNILAFVNAELTNLPALAVVLPVISFVRHLINLRSYYGYVVLTVELSVSLRVNPLNDTVNLLKRQVSFIHVKLGKIRGLNR